MIKKISVQVVFPVAVFAIYIYQFSQLNRNLDSIFDEGFLFLKIQAAQNGNIDGFSQWATLINSIFGTTISSNLLYLRYARYFIHVLSVTLFAIVTAWYLIKNGLLVDRQKIVIYISYVYLFGTVALGGIVLSYNHLQEFFLTGVLLSLLLSLETKSTRKPLFYFLLGLFSFFSIMTILPSGILVLVCVLVLTLVKEFDSGKTIIYFVSVFLGLLVATIFFHFFVLDLRVVYEKMTLTAQTITKLNRGYDPLSFIYKMIFYFRDFYIHICAFLGAIVLSALVVKFSNRSIAYIVFLLSVVVFQVYIRKPEIYTSTLLALPIVASFVAILFEISKIQQKKIMTFDVIFNFFLFFFPLISAIGTNTTLAAKMSVFILPWSLLIVKMMKNPLIKEKYNKEIHFFYWVTALVIISLPILSAASTFKSADNTKYYFNAESSVSSIVLSKKQKGYYEKVYQTMKTYNYHAGDLIFATQLDHMTITALSGIPCGIYFQPMDYLADDNKSRLHKPDFIFLTEYDSSIVYNSLRSQNWGFPEEFESYFVGTPETYDPGYPTERTLFCRKNRKIIK